MMAAARVALAGLLLAACGSRAPPPPPPPLLAIEMSAGGNQNPDAAGEAKPVALQLFYLAATARFERADVFALTEREQETLGPDGLGSEQFVLAPGERRVLTREPRPGMLALGVVALFRDVDMGAVWRVLVPIAAKEQTRVTLRTAQNRVVATSMP